MRQKQFKERFAILIVLLVLAFCLWIGSLVNGNKALNVFLTMLPVIAVVIALRITKEQYDKQGYFSKRQAAAFYKACKQAGLEKIETAAAPQWTPLYTASVGAFPSDDPKEMIRQAKRVFACGKEIEERKEKRS